jgi:succinate dehydrogenase / fumarate reductase, membrane anchor subunit
MKRELRSPFARATGLGSAKEGVEHWWAQRVSSVALALLGLWFVASLVALAGADRAHVVAWLHGPFAAILLILTLAAAFYHSALGLQVVIEDYVHDERVKIPAIIVMRLLCLALGAAGIFAVLRISFGSS